MLSSARTQAQIEDAAQKIIELFGAPNLTVTGMFTHFARADEEGDEGIRFTKEQLENYLAVRRLVENAGKQIPFHHVCNSAASIKGMSAAFDGARFGIVMYGASPMLHGELSLLPVMTLRTKIAHVHELNRGETAGYGGTFCAPEKMIVGVLPMGYADGFIRAYKGSFAAVRTASGVVRARILGRICMDQCMIDLSGTDAAVGDVAVLMGGDGPCAQSLAELAGSIDYETLCLISSRVPRFYKYE